MTFTFFAKKTIYSLFGDFILSPKKTILAPHHLDHTLPRTDIAKAHPHRVGLTPDLESPDPLDKN